MRKISVAAFCVASVLSLQNSEASTPIHFLYSNPNATYDRFQSDRDQCAGHATRTRWYAMGNDARWYATDKPSSTIFLNCMADKGYTLAKNGWDTGVLWVLPYRPAR